MEGKLSGLLLLIGALVFLFMQIELCISTSDLSQSSTTIIGNEQDLRASTVTQGGHNGIPYVILKGGGGGRGGGGKGGGSGGGSKGGGNGGKKRRGGSGTGDGSSGTGGRGGGGGSDSGGGGVGSRRSSGEPSANIGIGSWRSAMGLVMLTTLYSIM